MQRLSAPSRSRWLLPAWLSAALLFGVIFSAVVVLFLMAMTLNLILERPLNPLSAGIAEPIDPIEPDDSSQNSAVLTGAPTPALSPTTEPWSGAERINILLMGVDRRPGEPFNSRTDTMMLLSYSPQYEEAAILSIPRDLYVEIPGYGRNRINTAFVLGGRNNNPAGGAALAMETVTNNLGVLVNHYILVDFNAVVQTVDGIGGVEVDVPIEIYDPTYPDMDYGYDPLTISAGIQTLDGETALKYARTRHVDNDFGRAERQQQLLFAIRDQALDMGIANLLRQAPLFYGQVKEGVRTDLSVEEIIQLSRSVSAISDANIQTAVLDYNYVVSYTTATGASVLVPVNEKVAPLIQEMFFDEETLE